MYFDEKLKDLRIKKGLTLEELADALGISESVLESLETGFQDPNDKEMKKITGYFGVTAESLADDQPTVNAMSILFESSDKLDMGALALAAKLPGAGAGMAAKLSPAKKEATEPATDKDHISGDEYFMSIALLAAMRSNSAIEAGACLVHEDGRILGAGYNSLPDGCSDDTFSWTAEGELADTQYACVCHAELNAILSAATSLKGAKLYSTCYPCNECAKAIIQSGIKEVMYLSDKHRDTQERTAAERMFQSAGVAVRQYQETGREVKLLL